MKTKILILLATLYLVDARYYHHYDDYTYTYQQQMSKIIELLENISNNFNRPPPQLVYVPYPIVLNGIPTTDLATSAMKEGTAHNHGKLGSGALYNRYNQGPIKFPSRLEDLTMSWGMKDKEDETPQEQITDADSKKNYNFLLPINKYRGTNWGLRTDEEDSAASASEEERTVPSKTSLEDDSIIKPFFGEKDLHYDDNVNPFNLDPFKPLEVTSVPPVDHGSIQAGLDLNSEAEQEDTTHNYDKPGKPGTEALYNSNNPSPNTMRSRFNENSTMIWGVNEKEKEDKSPQEQIIQPKSKNVSKNEKNGEEDSAASVSEEASVPSETSLEDGLMGLMELYRSINPITSDPFKPQELTSTTPSVDSKQEVETTEKFSKDCTLAILSCCSQDASEVGSCFEMFNCTETYVPGITCVKSVTSNTFKVFKQHIPKNLKLV